MVSLTHRHAHTRTRAHALRHTHARAQMHIPVYTNTKWLPKQKHTHIHIAHPLSCKQTSTNPSRRIISPNEVGYIIMCCTRDKRVTGNVNNHKEREWATEINWQAAAEEREQRRRGEGADQSVRKDSVSPAWLTHSVTSTTAMGAGWVPPPMGARAGWGVKSLMGRITGQSGVRGRVRFMFVISFFWSTGTTH